MGRLLRRYIPTLLRLSCNSPAPLLRRTSSQAQTADWHQRLSSNESELIQPDNWHDAAMLTARPKFKHLLAHGPVLPLAFFLSHALTSKSGAAPVSRQIASLTQLRSYILVPEGSKRGVQFEPYLGGPFDVCTPFASELLPCISKCLQGHTLLTFGR